MVVRMSLEEDFDPAAASWKQADQLIRNDDGDQVDGNASSEVDRYIQFLSIHEAQLQSSGIPPVFWRSLSLKLDDEIFDAGSYFSINEVEYVEENDNGEEESNQNNTTRSWEVVVSRQEGISPEEPNHIFLIDHAWTFELSNARKMLSEYPGLLERMARLMDIADADLSKEETIESVMENIWRYNLTYTVQRSDTENDEPPTPVWYILDEFGSHIQHSDDPSFRIVPFYYVPTQISYSLLFPLKYVAYGGEVTRNYFEGPLTDELTFLARKLPWELKDFTDIDCNNIEADEDFVKGGRVEEVLPNDDHPHIKPKLPENRPLKVYTEYKYIASYLNDSRFEIVQSKDKADILWVNYHFKNYKELRDERPSAFVNQFPCEHVITVKDLLASTCRRKVVDGNIVNMETLDTLPKWLPTTYNLITELPKFVSYFQHRRKRKLDNHWICKPWNLARGLDTFITSNLNCIIRLRETGPKIACKYISNPVLFPRADVGMVKFDVRYILLLHSIRPLKAYVYKRFWLRFANRPFDLQDFDVYEKHFTVMNYTETQLKQMFCNDFIQQFEEHYPLHKWDKIEENIFAMFREVFEAASEKPPPLGLHPNPQSRAMYAADLMLEWNKNEYGDNYIQPKLLEINWLPDCQRACEYYPEFFNDVFSVLFLDECEGHHVQQL